MENKLDTAELIADALNECETSVGWFPVTSLTREVAEDMLDVASGNYDITLISVSNESMTISIEGDFFYNRAFGYIGR